MKKIIVTLISLVAFFDCFSQLNKFVFDISTSDGKLDLGKLISLIPRGNDRNIIVLSEMDHRQITVDSVKVLVVKKLRDKFGLDGLFVEWPVADYYSLALIKAKGLDRKEVIDYQSKVFKMPATPVDSEYIRDALIAYNSNFFKKLENIPVEPVDIGTFQPQFSLSAIAFLTWKLNTKRIASIDKFIDSIIFYHRQLFNIILFTEITDSVYNSFHSSFNRFLEALKANYDVDPYFIFVWKSFFDEFAHKYFGREAYIAYQRKRDDYNFSLYQNYRDSAMFGNFDWVLDHRTNWKNVVVSISSRHNLSNFRKEGALNKYMPSAYTPFTQRLVDKFGESVKRIAIVCFKCATGNLSGGYSQKEKNRSVEYMLAQKYKYAYLSLAEMRNDASMKDFEFYCRPTFKSFTKAKWQYIYDGIIFIRECECDR